MLGVVRRGGAAAAAGLATAFGRVLGEGFERLPGVAAAAGGAHHHDRPVQGQHQGEAPFQAGAAFADRLQGAELHAVHRQQQAVERQGQGVADNTVKQPDGDAQHHHAEEAFDVFHPLPGAGQEMAAAGAEDDQRHAHAQRQGEQRGGAGGRVAGAGHVEQGAGQDRGDAGGHHQGGNHAHQHGAAQAAAAVGPGVVEPVAQPLR